MTRREQVLEHRCSRFKLVIHSLLGLIDDDYSANGVFNLMFDNGLLTYYDLQYLKGDRELTDYTESLAMFFYRYKKHKECREKPPLGVTPRDKWDRERQCDLADAMVRYLKAGYAIPKEWLDEYNEISDKDRKETLDE
jgi:hypothetical protein